MTNCTLIVLKTQPLKKIIQNDISENRKTKIIKISAIKKTVDTKFDKKAHKLTEIVDQLNKVLLAFYIANFI